MRFALQKTSSLNARIPSSWSASICASWHRARNWLNETKAPKIILGASLIAYFFTYLGTGRLFIDSFFYGKEDTAAYVHSIWLLTNLRPDWTLAYDGYELSMYFGNHFIPAALLYTPVYFLIDNLTASITLEALSFTISAVPLYIAIRELTHHRWTAVMVVLVYLWQLTPVPLHFYFPVLVVPYFACGLLFVQRRQFKLALLCFVFGVMFKEYLGLAVAGLGVVLAGRSATRRLGFILLSFGMVWLVIALATMRSIQPEFPQISYAQFGESIGATDPGFSFQLVGHAMSRVLNEDNVSRWLQLLLPYGFIPLLGIEMLLPVTAVEILNAMATHREPWSATDHHTFIIMPFLVIAAGLGFYRLEQILTRRTLGRLLFLTAVWAMLFFGLYSGFRYHLYYLRQAYLVRIGFVSHIQDVRYVLRALPPNASVAAVENLEPAFSSRTQLIHMGNLGKHPANFVVVDSFYGDFASTNLALLESADPWATQRVEENYRALSVQTKRPSGDDKTLAELASQGYLLADRRGSLMIFTNQKTVGAEHQSVQ